MPKHTAKGSIHTANPLPCAAHSKGHTARQSLPLLCAIYRAHGKGFAVCKSRPTAKKKWPPAKVTWKWVCRVPCRCATRQRPNLCRVQKLLHTAKNGSFAVCHGKSTRQSDHIFPIFLFCIWYPNQHSQFIYITINITIIS